MEIGNIIHGHINEALGLNKDISEERKRICYQCPLYSTKFGGICNNKLWLNTETGDVSTYSQAGYKKGCGCKLSYKTENPSSKCPVGKW